MLRVTLLGSLLSLLLCGFAVADDEDDPHTRLLRATLKISHEKSTATGFILYQESRQRQVLVTAAHVLDPIPDEEVTLVFRTRLAEGEFAKAPVKVPLRQGGKPLYLKHATEDVAVLAITVPATADVPRVPVELLAGDDLLRKHRVQPGRQVAFLGYPHREEGSPAGFPLLRDGPIATYPLVPAAKNRTFYVSGNVFEGDSGGPVALADGPILGLVSGQRFLDEEAKMIYGTTRIRHRFGLASIVQAQFIKETLDQLP